MSKAREESYFVYTDLSQYEENGKYYEVFKQYLMPEKETVYRIDCHDPETDTNHTSTIPKDMALELAKKHFKEWKQITSEQPQQPLTLDNFI